MSFLWTCLMYQCKKLGQSLDTIVISSDFRVLFPQGTEEPLFLTRPNRHILLLGPLGTLTYSSIVKFVYRFLLHTRPYSHTLGTSVSTFFSRVGKGPNRGDHGYFFEPCLRRICQICLTNLQQFCQEFPHFYQPPEIV